MNKAISLRTLSIFLIFIFLANPTNSQVSIIVEEIGRVENYIYGFDTDNEYVYFADYSSRDLRITSPNEITNETSGGIISNYPVGPSEFAYDTAYHNNIVFLVTSGSPSGQLHIFDVGNVENPIFKSSIGLSFSAREVEYYNSHLYILSEFYVMIVDVSDINSPTELDYILPLTNPIDLEFYGSYLIVIDEYSGFRVLNIDSPSSPTQVSEFQYGENIRFKDADLQSNHLFMISSGVGVFEFDLNTNGGYDQTVSMMNTTDFNGICIEARQHIIIICQDTIKLFENENNNIENIESIELNHVSELKITDTHIIVAASTEGLVIYSHNIQFEQSSSESPVSVNYFIIGLITISSLTILNCKRNNTILI